MKTGEAYSASERMNKGGVVAKKGVTLEDSVMCILRRQISTIHKIVVNVVDFVKHYYDLLPRYTYMTRLKVSYI